MITNKELQDMTAPPIPGNFARDMLPILARELLAARARIAELESELDAAVSREQSLRQLCEAEHQLRMALETQRAKAEAKLDELGSETVKRLGIDVPTWAAEIRAKVATALDAPPQPSVPEPPAASEPPREIWVVTSKPNSRGVSSMLVYATRDAAINAHAIDADVVGPYVLARPTVSDEELVDAYVKHFDINSKAERGALVTLVSTARAEAMATLDASHQTTLRQLHDSIDAARAEAEAESPYCDVCGRSGADLSTPEHANPVEVCRDCYDVARDPPPFLEDEAKALAEAEAKGRAAGLEEAAKLCDAVEAKDPKDSWAYAARAIADDIRARAAEVCDEHQCRDAGGGK